MLQIGIESLMVLLDRIENILILALLLLSLVLRGLGALTTCRNPLVSSAQKAMEMIGLLLTRKRGGKRETKED